MIRFLILLFAVSMASAQDLPRWDLGPFKRPTNAAPILAASSNVWETAGTSSPAAIVRDGKICLLYAGSDKKVARIGLATSTNGVQFTRGKDPVLAPTTDPQRLNEIAGGCATPRIVETEDGAYVMTYVQRGQTASRLAVASSRDLVKWTKHGPAFGEMKMPAPGAGVIVTKLVNGKPVVAKIGGRFWMFWGEGKIGLAASTDLAHWFPVTDTVLAPRKDEFDADAITPGVAVITERGLLLVYHGRAGNVTATGQALLDPSQLNRVLLRAKFPTLRPQTPFERSRKFDNLTAVTSLVPFQDKWLAYYTAANGNVGAAEYDPVAAWAAANPGLTEPQDAATLPTSKTPPSAPLATNIAARNEARPDGALALRAGWKLAAGPSVNADDDAVSRPGFDDAAWWRATVPGTVLATLVDQGVQPDPYYGLNNMAIPESLNKQHYWYRVKFRTPADFAKRNVWLQFDGINYRADVWLNGTSLGQITGAFQRGLFDVTSKLVADADNVLAVKISPPPNPGIPHEESLKAGPGPNGGQLCKDGPTFICTEGWDWIPGIRDRCAGLWQDVLLRATGPVTLGDPQVVTKLPLPEVAPADVFVSIEAVNQTDVPQSGILRGSFEGALFEQKLDLAPREKRLVKFDPVHVAKPRLWWPNGYGSPELYRLNLAFLDATGRESDRKRMRFGIREVSYELKTLSPLPEFKPHRIEYTPTAERGTKEPAVDVRHAAIWNIEGNGMPTLRTNSVAVRDITATNSLPHLVIKVNGQRIYIRGGNWGMDDAMKRISREKLEPYVRLHRDAHLTMIRNWTGASTSDAFYELCDEYGLLVWSDFWVSTAKWNLDPTDEKLFLDNAADTIRRYRNHPSLAIWCGRNEAVPAPTLNEGLWRLIHELDGTRYYQPDSRQLSSMSSGPWDYRPPEFYSTMARGFNTELGTPSVPEAEVMRSFIPPTEQWPVSDTWAYHDWHVGGAVGGCWKYFAAVTNRFGDAKDLDDFCRKAQMINYDSHRAMFEAWNAKLWNPCSGLLAWMSHPSWPSMNWQFYTWDYDTHASYYGVHKACENVHIQLNQPDGTVTVVNNTLAPLKSLKATAAIYALDGKPLGSTTTNLDALANAAVTLAKAPVPTSTNTVAWLLRLELRGETLLSRNDYWLASKPEHYRNMDAMPRVTLKGQADTRGNVVTVKLQNPSFTPALMIRLTLRDPKTGARILPAYYSDNYFNLLPNEPRVITIETPKPLTGSAQVTAHGWNIQPSTFQ